MKNPGFPSPTQRGFKNCLFAGYSIILIFSFLLIFSCKKKKTVVAESTPEPPIPVQPATVQPTSLKIDSTNTAIKITKISSNLNYPNGFDLDGDSINDVKISLFQTKIHGGQLLIDYRVIFETLNSDTYILTDSIYPHSVFNCTTSALSESNANKTYPRGLLPGDSINLSDKSWRNGSFVLFVYGQEPDTLYCHNEWRDGNWYKYGVRYIGIKCRGKLNWFKLIVYNSGNYRLYEYATFKN